MPVKADLVLLLRDPKAELDAPWSALQLDATGRATDADWPWLARIAAERWTGNAVLLVDPTRMDADDGPVLLHWLTQQAAALVRRQLVPEVQTNSGHWLRRWLAEGDQGWRAAVPRVLQPDDGSFLDVLERTRDAAALRRDEAPSRLRQRTRSAFDKALEVAIRADRETQEKVAHGPRDKLRLAGRAASRIAGRAAMNSALIMLLGWATLLLIQLAGPTIPRTPAVGDATMALIGALSVLWLLAFHGTTLRWRLPWFAGRAARWVGLRIWWARWRLGTPPATWREYVQSTIEARYLEECGLPAGVWIHPPALPSRGAWLGAQAPVWLPDLSQRMKAVEGRRGVIVAVLVLVGWSGWMTEQHPELLQRLGVRFSRQFHSEGPNNEAAELLELGRTRIAAQDGPGAAAALTTCLQLEPTHAACLWELGWARWLEKDYAGAVTAWEALEAAGTWPSEELDRWIKTARIRAASQADPNR